MSIYNRTRIFLVAVTVVLGTVLSGAATAKSAYVIAAINATPTPIHSYLLGAAPNVMTFQAETGIPRLAGGAVGIALDEASTKLFITYEVSGTIQLVDAINFNDLGTTTAPGATNLSGIVYDLANNRVYTINRNTNNLYVYDWNSATNTLALVDGGGLNGVFELGGVAFAYGIAVDETTNRLYVADNSQMTVNYYDTTGFVALGGPLAPAGSITLTRHAPISIAVDPVRQFLYTGAAFNGNNDLVKYDLNPGAMMPLETFVNIPALTGTAGEGVIGVAVDVADGNVYATSGFSGDQLLAFDSALNLLQQLPIALMSGGGASPTGLVIPRTQVTFGQAVAQFFSGTGGNAGVGPLELLLGLLFLPLLLARRSARRIGSPMLAGVPGVGDTLFVSLARVWKKMTSSKSVVLLVLVGISLLFMGGCSVEPYKPWQGGDALWEKTPQASGKTSTARAAEAAPKRADPVVKKRADPVVMKKETSRHLKKSSSGKSAGSGWYLGAGIGMSDTDDSSSRYDRDLLGLGYTANSDLDTTDTGWKLYGGYNITRNWALEGAYVDLGEVTSDTTVTSGPPGWTPLAFVTAAATQHPYSVEGFTFSGKGTYPFWNGFSAFAKAGIFSWQADVKVKCNSCIAKQPRDEDGLDYTAGLGLGYDFGRNLGVRTEWERFGTDRDDVDLFSVSVQYRQ